jgi:integrase
VGEGSGALRAAPEGAFGRKRLDQIRRQEIQSFHAGLREEGLSPAYADHFVKVLRRALNLAVEWEMLERNPASRVHLFNADNRVEHYLEAWELERLLGVLREEGPRHRSVRLVALFLLSTGARLNEALRARWQDVDRPNRVWRIPARSSKSGRVRSVPLNASALEVLDRLGAGNSREYLFVNGKTGRPYTSVHKAWRRLRAEAGLPHLRIHDLRHQYASFLVNSGRTLYEVQNILGHSDPSVTQRYAHLSTRSLQDAANGAAEAIGGGGHVPGPRGAGCEGAPAPPLGPGVGASRAVPARGCPPHGAPRGATRGRREVRSASPQSPPAQNTFCLSIQM